MKTALIILDGRGISSPDQSHRSAIAQANTAYFDRLRQDYPHATLVTHGEQVGLPDGQMGNSEVGHMNIGAGRVVYQDLVKINKAIHDDTLQTLPILQSLATQAKTTKQAIHLIGLLSDGGVHSHHHHLYYLIDFFEKQGIQTCIHAILDGRDVDPKSGYSYVSEFLSFVENKSSQLVDVVGRYYAMDRDNRRERVQVAYDLYVHGVGQSSEDILTTITSFYNQGITDEFMPAIRCHHNTPTLQDGSIALITNFRTDRGRELVSCLSQQSYPEHQMRPLSMTLATMTNYDDSFKDIAVIFPRQNMTDTLGEVISKAGKRQIRIAETEKYPHVTFFFSGGQETPFDHEQRILIPSPKVATYDLQPAMSAPEITQAILPEIEKKQVDCIILNFANTDMVGHTGDMRAAILATETVDACLQQIVECGLDHDYTFIIIADHGNSDIIINEDGSPNTAHTLNPVPIIVVSKDSDEYVVSDGKLADIAPTILSLMDISIPEVMDGEVIVRKVSETNN